MKQRVRTIRLVIAIPPLTIPLQKEGKKAKEAVMAFGGCVDSQKPNGQPPGISLCPLLLRGNVFIERGAVM